MENDHLSLGETKIRNTGHTNILILLDMFELNCISLKNKMVYTHKLVKLKCMTDKNAYEASINDQYRAIYFIGSMDTAFKIGGRHVDFHLTEMESIALGPETSRVVSL